MHGTVVVSASAQQPPETDAVAFDRGPGPHVPMLAGLLLLAGIAFLGIARLLLARRRAER